jgi:activator of HSP90 ATPase
MDAWTSDQIKVMKFGGNQQCNEFLQQYGDIDPFKTSIREKYDNPVAQIYKEILKARVAGLTEPSSEDILVRRQIHKENLTNKYVGSAVSKTTVASDTDDDEEDCASLQDVASRSDGSNTKSNTERNRPRLSLWIDTIQKTVPERLAMRWMKRTIAK